MVATPWQGREVAFEQMSNAQIQELFEEHSGDIYRLLLSLTRSADDADDLLQEVFVAAFKYFGPNVQKTRNWLVKIAYNKYIQFDKVRKAAKEGALEERHEPQTKGSFTDEVEWKLLKEEISKKLARNDPILAHIFMLRVENNLGPAEIAEILDIPRRSLTRKLDDMKRVILQNFNQELESLLS